MKDGDWWLAPRDCRAWADVGKCILARYWNISVNLYKTPNELYGKTIIKEKRYQASTRH